MPNRILKETIRTSKKVNGLSDFEFRVWAYLITYVDDYGRGSADPELLKGLCFPRRKGITENQIADALSKMANTGIIHLYESDGESYFCFPNWDKHQQIRAKKSKYPAPTNICNHMISDDIKCPRNPIQSESNPNPNPVVVENAPASHNDPDLSEVVTAYQDALGKFLDGMALRDVVEYYKTLGKPLMLHALSEATANAKLNWSYIRAILRGYIADGCKSLADVQQREKRREAQKTDRKYGKANSGAWAYSEPPKSDADAIAAMFARAKGAKP